MHPKLRTLPINFIILFAILTLSICSSSEPKVLSLNEFRIFPEHLCESYALPDEQVRPAESGEAHQDHINYDNENWYDGLADLFTDIDPKVYLKVCLQILKDKDRAHFTVLDTGKFHRVHVYTIRPYPVARFSMDVGQAGSLEGAGQAFELAREKEPALDQLLYAYQYAKQCSANQAAEKLKAFYSQVKADTTMGSDLKNSAAHIQTIPPCQKEISTFGIPGYDRQWPLGCRQNFQCSPWGTCSTSGVCEALSQVCTTSFDCPGRGKCISGRCQVQNVCWDWATGRYGSACN